MNSKTTIRLGPNLSREEDASGEALPMRIHSFNQIHADARQRELREQAHRRRRAGIRVTRPERRAATARV